jgi:hypothetical protein
MGLSNLISTASEHHRMLLYQDILCVHASAFRWLQYAVASPYDVSPTACKNIHTDPSKHVKVRCNDALVTTPSGRPGPLSLSSKLCYGARPFEAICTSDAYPTSLIAL